MDITHPHKHLNIRFMRMTIQWITKEENKIQFSCSHLGSYLGITSYRP